MAFTSSAEESLAGESGLYEVSLRVRSTSEKKKNLDPISLIHIPTFPLLTASRQTMRLGKAQKSPGTCRKRLNGIRNAHLVVLSYECVEVGIGECIAFVTERGCGDVRKRFFSCPHEVKRRRVKDVEIG